MKDYYEILGISKNATADEIKSAYRKLALQYHPDRNKTKEADIKFKEVTKAYEVLSDEQKRKTYDQFGAAAFEQGGPAGGGPFGGQTGQYGPFTYSYQSNGDFDFGGFSDPFEIFEQFFGGGFSQRQRRPVYSLTIDFMEAIHGTEKKVTIEGKTQTIKIPAGVDDRSRIRFGNYDVLLSVKPDKRFQREGSDIITEQEISFPEAALGTELSVTTVNGVIKVRVPPGTQPNTLMRLKGKGVPRLHAGGSGDHYIKIKVTVPTSLTGKQKEILQEFEKVTHDKKKWF